MAMSNGVTGGVFANLSDLQASKPRVNTIVQLTNGAKYKVVTSDTGANLPFENGNFAEPIEPITPEHFGAVGDGVNDDTAAINLAKSAANNFNSSLLLTKTYVSDGITFDNDIPIIALGAKFILRSESTSNIALTFNARAQIEGLSFDLGAKSPSVGIYLNAGGELSDLLIENGQSSGGFGEGIRVLDGNDYRLNNLKISNCGGTGLAVSGGSSIIIDNINIDQCTTGIDVNTFSGTTTTLIRDVSISNCVIDNVTNNGLRIGRFKSDNDDSSQNFGTNNRVERVSVNNVTTTNCGVYGVVLSARYMNCTNITSMFNTLGGMLINGSFMSISSIQVSQNTSFGIDVGGANYVNISGGTINNTNGGSSLLLEACKDCKITDLDLYGSTGVAQVVVNSSGAPGGGVGFGVGDAARNYMSCNVQVSSGGFGIVMRGDSQFIDDNTYFTVNAGDKDFTRYLDGPAPTMKNIKVFDAVVDSGVMLLPETQGQINYNGADNISDFQSYSYSAFEGEVTNINITNGGSGYNPLTTTVAITGDGVGPLNTGVFVNNGEVDSIRVHDGGSGFTSATVTISGDGTGATATATIGKNKASLGQSHSIRFNQAITITGGIQAPAGTLPLSIPAQGVIEIEERFGRFTLTGKNF